MATLHFTKKQFGSFNIKGDKITTFRKPLNASQRIAKRKKANKGRIVTRAMTRGFGKP